MVEPGYTLYCIAGCREAAAPWAAPRAAEVPREASGTSQSIDFLISRNLFSALLAVFLHSLTTLDKLCLAMVHRVDRAVTHLCCSVHLLMS